MGFTCDPSSSISRFWRRPVTENYTCLGPFEAINTKGGLQTFSAGARSLVRIVKKLTFTPAYAATLAAFYIKGSNAQIGTCAKSETVVFLLDLLDAIGP